MNAIQEKPRSLRVIQVLFALLALLWAWVALRYLRFSGGGMLGLLSNLAIAGLLFVKVFLMLVIGWGLPRFPNFFYPFGLMVLMVDILLTIFDQMGTPETINLGLDCALLGLMLATRKNLFLQNGKAGH